MATARAEAEMAARAEAEMAARAEDGNGGSGAGGNGGSGGGHGNGGGSDRVDSGPVSNPTRTFNGTVGTGTPPQCGHHRGPRQIPPVDMPRVHRTQSPARDAEIGAALVAGGWAMKYWASRMKKEQPTS